MGKNWRADDKGYEHHFRIMREACSVYRHFDADGRLLYVGIARNARRRRFQHKCGDWGKLIVRSTVVDYQTRAEALEVEARAIAFERPLYNRRRPFRPFGLNAEASVCPVLADLYLRKTPASPPSPRPVRQQELPRFDYADWIRCLSEVTFYEE